METTDSEAICRLFHSYDFEGDLDFQSGCKTILQHLDQETTENTLQTKLFYFSRKFGKLTLSDYKRWLRNTEKRQTDQRLTDSEQRKMHINHKSTETSIDEFMFNIDKTKKAGICHSDECNDPTRDGTASNELCGQFNSQTDINKVLSEDINNVLSEKEDGKVSDFGQVVEMISKGLPLPDVTELGIRPLDVEPTTARMERKTKPWEQG
ncbi:uncharacterized protein LOC125649374 [Ostrea edulis]|uniref:uncharacterized protein LOC125649374 n=1 Tax=Ostrea edulis TaxID=37623 RepID=UPI002094ABAE|nr:uncharacterized protein LOC125649374 [Ostrea edulis]